MTKLYNRILSICDEKNLTIYAIEKGAGLSDRSLRKWKDSIPSGDKILRVANFLDVSTDYLLGNTGNPHSHKNNPQDLAAAAKEIADLAEETKRCAAGAADRLSKILSAHHIG